MSEKLTPIEILSSYIETNSPFSGLVSAEDAMKAMDEYGKQFGAKEPKPSGKIKIYIAGKVTDTNMIECINKFGIVKKELEAKGYEVVNPLEVVGDSNAKWIPAMKQCLMAMLGCDEIYLLSDWQDSKGAKIEQAIAYNLKMPMHVQGEIRNFNHKTHNSHDTSI